MGKLITTNSATLVNKGLEVIEAHLLFDVPYDRIEVVVHPQSVVHSMVEFVDGSTLAQASPPDMRLTISLALGWPDRVVDAARPVDWTRAQNWTFEPLDSETFPAVDLAKPRAGPVGAPRPSTTAPTRFWSTPSTPARWRSWGSPTASSAVLTEWLRDHHAETGEPGTVEAVEQADAWARERAVVFAERTDGRG